MAPVVTSVSPAQGNPAGGTPVTINGSGFIGATVVRFGPNLATNVVVVSNTQITARTPPGSGTAKVTVTGPTGTSTQNVFFTYTTVAAPVLTALSPASGPTGGGNTVTLTGTNLTGATQVLFGATPATILTNTATQITATAPAGPASVVNVTVTTPGGISNPLSYIYVAAPVVTGVSPQFGPDTGGNSVTVTGSGLALASAVHFGPTLATGFTVISDNQLTATAPPGTGTVVVTVTTPGGTSTLGPGNPYYTYLGAPVIDSLIPDEGSSFGGDSVTINGSNLTYTDSVTFGGVPASFSVLSDNLAVATAPAHAAGTVNVQLHTPAGNSNTLPFTYDPV
ncbi:IPT/TIG domain-containing protein [Streptomyces javensis]|uniref:IPT/TIG domain-containing protein n=1 Tax=Streptomyces javensis TaxID=114698 RepID=A0ABS0R8L1_9ACTN|nr:IPT/TIG domain-containing protein [Streptomyces javensis]MBI0313648.1 IPT/TIG domain-containing protein [Streptomyces javensis]